MNDYYSTEHIELANGEFISGFEGYFKDGKSKSLVRSGGFSTVEMRIPIDALVNNYLEKISEKYTPGIISQDKETLFFSNSNDGLEFNYEKPEYITYGFYSINPRKANDYVQEVIDFTEIIAPGYCALQKWSK